MKEEEIKHEHLYDITDQAGIVVDTKFTDLYVICRICGDVQHKIVLRQCPINTPK